MSAEEDMPTVESFSDALSKLVGLRMGKSGAVIGSVDDTSEFMDSLYVPTAVDDIAEDFFGTDNPDGRLFILLGSAGDGKTAIFGRAYNASDAEWLKPYHLNLDATESTSATRTKSEQLHDFLETTTEDIGVEGAPNKGLAINLGLALNFFGQSDRKENFDTIWSAIDDARHPENLDDGCVCHSGSDIVIANLSHRRMFNTHPDPGKLGEGLLSNLVRRFDHTDEQSPFYPITEEIDERSTSHPVAYNLNKLADNTVRESIIRLLAAKAMISNEYLNPRRVLDYLSKIMVPKPLVDAGLVTDLTFEDIADDPTLLEKVPLWNSVYETLTKAGHESTRLDPCMRFDLNFDEKILALRREDSVVDSWGNSIHIDRMCPAARARTAIRKEHLEDRTDRETEEYEPLFKQFAATRTVFDNLCSVDNPPEDLANEAHETVIKAIKRWSRGSSDEDMVQISDGQDSVKYRFFSEPENEMDSRPASESFTRTTEETQLGKLWFAFGNGVAIPLSYELYRMLVLITEGYNPDAVNAEESEGIRLIHSQISRFTKKTRQLEVYDTNNEVVMELKRNMIGDSINLNS